MYIPPTKLDFAVLTKSISLAFYMNFYTSKSAAANILPEVIILVLYGCTVSHFVYAFKANILIFLFFQFKYYIIITPNNLISILNKKLKISLKRIKYKWFINVLHVIMLVNLWS